MKTKEEIIKQRYPFYDENLSIKDVELDGSQVQVLMEEYAIEYFNNHCQKSIGKSLEKRKEEFERKVPNYQGTYSSGMIDDFCAYWTESSDNGKKMRFEMQKVFDIKKRLKTWNNNNIKFNGGEKKSASSAPNLSNWGKAKD